MNDIKSIKKEIDSILCTLIKSNISSYQNFPIIKNVGTEQRIEWSEVKNLSVSLKNLDYDTIYSEIDKNSDYTMKLIDGNIIQMMYTFDKNKLISHRLAMFPSPKLDLFQDQPDIYKNDQIYGDIIERKIVPFPIRFDFNSEDITSSHTHPNSHVTLGQYKNCRIPAYGPISPKIFMEFVLENFYNTYFTEMYSSLQGKRLCTNYITIKNTEQKKMHFNII